MLPSWPTSTQIVCKREMCDILPARRATIRSGKIYDVLGVEEKDAAGNGKLKCTSTHSMAIVVTVVVAAVVVVVLT